MENEQQQRQYMTFDEVSMERSKSFINALQELKNLRPQMYSAAEYCEKSYLNSDQKHLLLDNLKEYTLRALVNAVDHLGTVAYKLTDLVDQQTVDVSLMELNVSRINQQLLTCQEYENMEITRQQKFFTIIPRHHKHYVLPNSVSKRVHFSPHVQADARQSHFRSQLLPSSSPAAKTLSWHLGSESDTVSMMKGTPLDLTSSDDSKAARKPSPTFQLLDKDIASTLTRSPGAPVPLSYRGSASNVITQTLGTPPRRESFDGSKPMTPFRSFDDPRCEAVHVPARGKSMLSAFFVKPKTQKLKPRHVF